MDRLTSEQRAKLREVMDYTDSTLREAYPDAAHRASEVARIALGLLRDGALVHLDDILPSSDEPHET